MMDPETLRNLVDGGGLYVKDPATGAFRALSMADNGRNIYRLQGGGDYILQYPGEIRDEDAWNRLGKATGEVVETGVEAVGCVLQAMLICLVIGFGISLIGGVLVLLLGDGSAPGIVPVPIGIGILALIVWLIVRAVKARR